MYYDLTLPKPIERATLDEIGKGFFFGIRKDDKGCHEIFNLTLSKYGGVAGVFIGKCNDNNLTLEELYDMCVLKKHLK